MSQRTKKTLSNLPPAVVQMTTDQIDRQSNQFPLVVFFELTAIVAVIFAMASVTGQLTASLLAIMALSMLWRRGMLAAISFGVALLGIPIQSQGEAVVLCILLGIVIATWPMLHATTMRLLQRNA